MYTIDYTDLNDIADAVTFDTAAAARDWVLLGNTPVNGSAWITGPGIDQQADDWANGLPPTPSLTPAQRRAARLPIAYDDDGADYDGDADCEAGDSFVRSLDAGQGGSFQHMALMLEVRPHDDAARRYRFALSAFERAFDLVVSVDDPTYYEVEPGEWVRIDDPLEWHEAVKARAAR